MVLVQGSHVGIAGKGSKHQDGFPSNNSVHATFQETQLLRWLNFKQGWMDRHNSVIWFWKRNHKGCKGLTSRQNFQNIQNKIFKEVSELMSQFNVVYEGDEVVSH